MSKAPEQIFASKQSVEAPTSCVISFTEPSEEYTVQYTRTDYAQAQVAAAYEAAAQVAISDGCDHTASLIASLTPTDAKAALDRIVQEAVEKETRRIYKMLCDMGEAEFKVNNSHDAQLFYHAASKVAALKGGEA